LGVTGNLADVEDTPEIVRFFSALFVEGQEAGRLQSKHCIPRHQSIVKGDVGVIGSRVLNFAEATAHRPQQSVGVQMLTGFASIRRDQVLVTSFGYAGSFHGSLRYQKTASVSRKSIGAKKIFSARASYGRGVYEKRGWGSRYCVLLEHVRELLVYPELPIEPIARL